MEVESSSYFVFSVFVVKHIKGKTDTSILLKINQRISFCSFQTFCIARHANLANRTTLDRILHNPRQNFTTNVLQYVSGRDSTFFLMCAKHH